MNNNNNNNLKNFWKKNGFSVAIYSTIAILLVATMYFSYSSFNSSKSNHLVKNNEIVELQAVDKSNVKSFTETETETTSDLKQSEKVTEQTTEQQKDTTQSNKETSEDSSSEDTKSSTKENSEEESKSSEEAKVFSMFDEGQEMTWPVSGQIIMDYSIETSVYDKTLELYRTNDSICISSPEGTDVMAAAEGIVENIYTDNENGKTIVINHGNGWLSTYSQLQEEVSVTVGQVVKEGEFIAKIGSPSNYSVLLGPHLNFKITKDDITSDPKLVLAQIEE